MRLRPRHYLLLALIIGIFVYNIVRNRRHVTNTSTITTAPVVITGPRAQSPGWEAFDHAAALRDAPGDQFEPAAAALQQQLAPDSRAPDPHAPDIKGCQTWLAFYRQGMAQTRTAPQMKDRSARHIDGCVKYHLDTTL